MTRVDPGLEPVVERVLESIDRWGETVFDGARHGRIVDITAAVLSNLSDFGLVWVVVAGLKARRPGPGRRRAVLALALAGVTSYSVNRATKRLVGRRRPDLGSSPRPPLAIWTRPPASPSFPSGHTLAAFCTALVLADGPSEAAAALLLAAAVAASRVHLGAHHLSDVVAGAAIGAAAGLGVRAVLDRTCPDTPVEYLPSG